VACSNIVKDMRLTGEPTVIERRSVVEAPADRVWQRVVTPEGINDELGPWMTMSMPRGAESLTVDTVPVGTPIGRAWLRLFGVLPFDYDQLTIAELQPGRSFREESTMLSMSRWQHERSVTPDGTTKAVVHDRITFQPRAWLRFATPVLEAGIGALFGHRHRRLQRHFAATG
jgi:ligand-binding SRPBCC domain-containing protein